MDLKCAEEVLVTNNKGWVTKYPWIFRIFHHHLFFQFFIVSRWKYFSVHYYSYMRKVRIFAPSRLQGQTRRENHFERSNESSRLMNGIFFQELYEIKYKTVHNIVNYIYSTFYVLGRDMRMHAYIHAYIHTCIHTN